MKRGFLLRAEERKSAAKRRGVQKQTEPSASSKPAAEPRQYHEHEGKPTSSVVEAT